MIGYGATKVIGSGTMDDPYRADVNVPCSSIIPSNPDGTPKFNWCLVRLKDYEGAAGINLFKFPSGALTMKVSDIPAAKRQAIKGKMESFGIDTSWIKGSNTLKEILRKIGRHLDINFKVLGDRFD